MMGSMKIHIRPHRLFFEAKTIRGKFSDDLSVGENPSEV